MSKVSVFDVFRPQGQPHVTYVHRDQGAFERKLGNALDSAGTLCFLTGPSKSGKATLYSRVAEDKNRKIVRVRCSQSLDITEIWKVVLEEINYERVVENSKTKKRNVGGTGEVEGNIFLSIFAGLKGKAGVSIESEASDSEQSEYIRSNPATQHIIPLLKSQSAMLVIEDFHYLKANVLEDLFEQLKSFVDSQLSVVLVGVAHHVIDIIYSNKDLLGRILHIELGAWKPADLREIARKGFEYLHISYNDIILDLISNESVGLPILTQSISQEICLSKNITDRDTINRFIQIDEKDVYMCLNRVAVERYSAFSETYDRLTRPHSDQPEEQSVFEIILSTFSVDGLAFSLTREEIVRRLPLLPIPSSKGTPAKEKIYSSLVDLKENQAQIIGIDLIEYSHRNFRLYITEPTFLFYLRWRFARLYSPSYRDILKDILDV
jgi:AAA domain